MILSVRRVHAPALDALIENRALVHTRYRVHAVVNRAVISEDRLMLSAFTRAGRTGRPVATVVLNGEARMSAYDRDEWLEAGDVIAMDRKDGIAMRQEGRPFASLVLEWDEGWLGPRPAPFTRARLDGATLARTQAIHEAVQRACDANDTRIGAEAGARFVEVLAGAGLVRKVDPAELVEDVPDQTRRLAHGLDVAFSNMNDQPMVADLEVLLGASARHVNRLVADFNARYGFNAAGWRDARNRRRLMMGATLMSAPGATAEYVARVVGYRSAAAFSRALSEAGFPPPSAIAQRMRELGRRA